MDEEKDEGSQDEELDDLDLGAEETEDVTGGRGGSTIGGD